MEDRQAAARLIRKMGSAGLSLLKGLLSDGRHAARQEAALDVAAALGGRRVREAVLPLACSRNERLRLLAVRALRAMQPDYADLLPCLGDASWRVRREAVFGLSAMGCAEASLLLIQTLRDRQPEVRAAAANVLGMLARPTDGPALRAAACDPSPLVRDMVAWGLRRMTTPGGSLTEALSAIKAAAALEREACFLARVAELGFFDDPLAARTLGRLLRDRCRKVRREAAVALGRSGRAEAAPLLEHALSTGRDPALRAAAALGLCALRDAGCQSLARMLRQADDAGRALAARGLGGMAAHQAAEPLYAALADPCAAVRQEAAWAIQRIKQRLAPERFKPQSAPPACCPMPSRQSR